MQTDGERCRTRRPLQEILASGPADLRSAIAARGIALDDVGDLGTALGTSAGWAYPNREGASILKAVSSGP